MRVFPRKDTEMVPNYNLFNKTKKRKLIKTRCHFFTIDFPKIE